METNYLTILENNIFCIQRQVFELSFKVPITKKFVGLLKEYLSNELLSRKNTFLHSSGINNFIH